MKKSIILGAVLVAAGAVQAATINWDAAQNITADTDVSVNGTSEWAYSFGNEAASTINGQVFTTVTTGTGNTDFTTTIDSVYNGAFDGGTAASWTDLTSNYQSILSSAAGENSSASTITLNGLTSGDWYEVQFWINDTRTGKYTRTATINGTDPAVVLNYGQEDNGAGMYALGTFQADAAMQSFDLSHNDSRGAQLNAIQLRAIPEPATLGLIATFGGSLLFIRRRIMI